MGNLIQILQGEDFRMKFVERDLSGTLVNLATEYLNVFVYVWTAANNILKYSRETLEGYGDLQVLSDTEINIYVEAIKTKTLAPGAMNIEIMVINQDESQHSIFTGKVCMIVHSHIKAEVTA